VKLEFLGLSPEDRRLYLEQAALRRGVSAVVLEKDFWVCWLLRVLFDSEFAGALVFKGGTSLSKVFGVIGRFSEDIDLSLSPEFLGLPPAGTSRNQANKWMAKAEAACGAAVQDRIAPVLEASVIDVLGGRDGTWFEYSTDPVTHSPVLLFHYPTTQSHGFEYLKRSVKLEFGSLTDQQPTGRHPVRPWVADTIPMAFPDWRCEVVALEVERTFWEKATILHAGGQADARPVLSPLCGHGGAGPASCRVAGNRPSRPPQSGRGVERPVLRQFVGELRRREAGNLPARPDDRAPARAAA
jgi:hypothetical protein